ncbi:sensor histidine kinase [Microbacterium sp. APC 3898]|uniref:histidine kinase n=1 Tax=Planococcus notacanthi TaxID=3035188 RepID=A0ABT7ZHS1_9BACL|nr:MULTISPECIES: sensor histidine kinase [Terrabacteria group]MDN3426711.1 sensor histidine kinase [Planococcus sp. APC 4016]MDN3500221.1 sensor histidine kinase [Microbacterium sp. APC 3898]
MFFSYINDMKSWIFFFFLSLLSADLLLWLDPGIDVEISSLVYVNALLLIAFIAFISWRYYRETAYIRQLALLEEETETDWYEALPDPIFERDEQVNDILQSAGISFSKQLSEVRQNTIIQDDYIAGWVHEAKAPLTAMKLVIDANRKDPQIRKIEAEWLRIFLLVDQQLYISRLSSLESDYVLERVPLQEIIAAEVRELMSWCREKNLAIEIEGLETNVVTDRKWCRFIVRQILSNAVKYSPRDGTIFITTRTEAGGHCILSIKDQGAGIPDHDMPRIFDKGFTGGMGRLHNTATGLGLYLAKTVSEKIGIRLSAISTKGKGATLEMGFTMENDFDQIRR